MNTKQKKALYESIMKNVAKQVKHTLNEQNVSAYSANTGDYDFDEPEISEIEDVIYEWINEYPELDKVIRELPNIKYSYNIAFAAVDTKINQILVNPVNIYEYCQNKNIDMIGATAIMVIHEIMHIRLIQLDNTIFGINTTGAEQYRQNIAIDKAINQILIKLAPRMESYLKKLNAML